jgi:hypothetical protein
MNDFQNWFSANYPNLTWSRLMPSIKKRIQLKFEEIAKQKAYRQSHASEIKAKQKAYYQRPEIKAKQRHLVEERRKFHLLPLSKRREIILANHRRLV